MNRVALLSRVAWMRWQQERSGRFSPEQLHAHQQAALQALRRFVLERSAFYRDFHRGLEGRPLADLPILDKAAMMAHFDALVTDPALRLSDLEAHLAGDAVDAPYLGRYTVLATSGSTGRRGVFVFNPREWAGALAAITRPLSWAGAPSPWSRPRAALIASGLASHYSARIGRALATPLVPTLRLDAALPLAELVARLNDWRPDTLAVYPSNLLPLAEEQLAGRLRIALRHVGTSAERLTEATRARVREAWGIEVFDTYGATEYAPIATVCREGQMHLLEDRAIIEVVDGRGRPVPPGEPGERLLLTVLDRRTQPLIRYEISDGVCERPGRCACGRPFRMLASIEGRVEEHLAFDALQGEGQVVVHANRVHEVMETAPVTGWQVRQGRQAPGAGGALQLEVLLTGPADGAAAQTIRRRMAAMLLAEGARCDEIRVRWVEALPRGATGKAPLIVALRPASFH